MAKPKRRKCACMEVFFRLCDDDPKFLERQDRLEADTRRLVSSRMAARATPYVIPVVVHVVHRAASENISDAQVNSQIKVLNEDFRAKNSDKSKVPSVWQGLVADANIEFRLATKDPKGNETNGIVTKKTDRFSFSQDDSVKFAAQGGSAAWPRDRYLNIWVCTLGGGLLGYAQFPGGPASTDGVVILNTAFGTTGTASAPFNKGRTASHEVGHFLNLRHIWGDTTDCSGSDFASDTPTQRLPNTGKPSFPHISCTNGPSGDMFMNYMDYVDDAVMFMFTPGQVARMYAALQGPRKKLVSGRAPRKKPKAKRRRAKA